MKRILFSGVLAAVLTAGLQAYAQDPAFTNNFTVGTGSGTGGWPLVGSGPYSGSISDANLKSGPSLAFSDSGYSIISGSMSLVIWDGNGSPITLWMDNSNYDVGTVDANGTGNYTCNYTLTGAELTYINSHNPILFEVSGDCYLESGTLIVNANTVSQSAPDSGSTVLFLGGVMSVLGLMKRKMA